MGFQRYIFVLLYILQHSCLLSSKKLSTPTILSSDTVDECTRCKILSESFIYWMDKTSRGKFEGGDAAWEETKLKSYSRSEVRLVEIQEGLCSEVKKYQDHCYSFVEEAEQPLESWWFKEDSDIEDLYSWLCIDTLPYCCPKLHYGEFCHPCILNKDRNICGGRGKCNGEGTRKGNGSCICNKGYTGSNCENCDKNFYMEKEAKCKACHKACEGCIGSGPTACISCKSGWTLKAGECLDIDECLIKSICNSNQYCVNIEGSHLCKNCEGSCESCSGPGFNKCTSCNSGKLLWSGMCIDEKVKYEFVLKAIQRLSLYTGLFLISVFVFRKSKLLAYFVIVIIAIYIYFAESKSKMSSLEIMLSYAFKSR